ncbi:lactase-phlorizin hydrolase-like [Anopheles merus]|nr:lactase-phlorizin hydrolase-like [Anopheles merus]
MTDCVEIALTSDTAAQHWSCCVWDVRTGTQLMTYRNGGPAGPNTLHPVGNQCVVAGNLTKPLLTFWPVNRQEPSHVKYMLPGPPGAVAVSPDGNHCLVAHAHAFTLYSLPTGASLASVAHHYGKVTVLRFTDDGSHFVSAGQDCRVVVWSLARTVQQKDAGRMLYELADFTLPVSDVLVGKGGLKALLAAVSLDRSAKLYELGTGRLLLSVLFPVALSAVALNALESELFVGDRKGLVYACNLQSVPRSREVHLQQDVLERCVFRGHRKAVTCLSVSLDNETLLSGSEDESVIVWHVRTRQQLRVIPHRAPVTNAFFLVTPRAMFEQTRDLPVPYPPFQKVVSTRQDRERAVFLLPAQKRSLRERSEEEPSPVTVGSISSSSSSSKGTEIEVLEQEVQRLKAINRRLYQQSIRAITNEVEPSVDHAVLLADDDQIRVDEGHALDRATVRVADRPDHLARVARHHVHGAVLAPGHQVLVEGGHAGTGRPHPAVRVQIVQVIRKLRAHLSGRTGYTAPLSLHRIVKWCSLESDMNRCWQWCAVLVLVYAAHCQGYITTGMPTLIERDRDPVASFPYPLRQALGQRPSPPPYNGTEQEPGDELKFPANFLFGAATAAYQIEGAWNVDGKGPSVWDTLTHTHPELVVDGATGDRAADSYRLYRSDVEALEKVGFNYYRFSIAWSRLLPRGDRSSLNQGAVRYYNALINALLAHGIEPVVTMLHYDLPQYLQNLGGFASPLIVDYFREYADTLYWNFGDRVKVWITHNEPYDFCVEGYGTGSTGPLVYATGVGEYLCAHHVLLSHAAAYQLYKERYRSQQRGKIGITLSGRYYYPATNVTPYDTVERALLFQIGWFAEPLFGEDGNYPAVMVDEIGNNSALERRSHSRLPTFTSAERLLVRGSADFFAYNYYSSRLVELDRAEYNTAEPPAWRRDARILQSVDPGWSRAKSTWLYVVPEGLRGVLNWFRRRYRNPTVLITENGYSDDGQLDDAARIDYYARHLDALLTAVVVDGCNVAGFTAWSIIDNFEWLRGYSEKFGLFYVNFSDPQLQRVPKASADFMRRVISTRTIPAH